MFTSLRETIKGLNADVNNVANSEKAKKLRRRLLWIGLPLAIIGIAGALTCFILFVTAMGIPNPGAGRVMIPFFMIIPTSLVAALGWTIASLGFKIVITGYTANLVKETVGHNCPNCGGSVDLETLFCPKCGTKVKKECSNCKHINSYRNDYCEKCGTKLD